MSKEENFRTLVLTSKNDIYTELEKLKGWKIEKNNGQGHPRILTNGNTKIYLREISNTSCATCNIMPQDENSEKRIPLKQDVLYKLQNKINNATDQEQLNIETSIQLSDNDLKLL